VRLLPFSIACVALIFALTTQAKAIALAGFGDSLTNGASYLDYLTADSIYNLGVGGETTSDGLPRLQTWLGDNEADFVIVLEGTNDVFRSGYDEGVTAGNLAAMIDAVTADGAIPILLAPPPILPPSSADANLRAGALAIRLAEVATARGIQFIDLYSVFLAQADPAALFYEGGIHPNAAGNQLVASQILLVSIPEPSTALLLGWGLAWTASRRRR